MAVRRTRVAASDTITEPVCRSPWMRHSLFVTNVSRNERMPATTCASAVPRGDNNNNNNGAAGTFASARSAAACGASSSEHLPN